MIDEKKIEEAANKYAIDTYPFTDPVPIEYKEGIQEIFQTSINWFLKNLWHSANEVAKDNSDLVYVNINNEVRSTEDYNRDLYDDNFGSGWRAYVRNTNLVKWAYKEDLLPSLFKEK